jgi:hypothetical protein
VGRGFTGSLSSESGLSCLFLSPETNSPERLNKPDRTDSRPAPRNVGLQDLTLILLLVQNFTNSLQAGNMNAYLHASTYVPPTLLLTFLSPRRGP